MTTPESIVSEIQKVDPSAIIELFVLDATSVGAGTFRFHAGTNGLSQNIIWQGETYVRYPVEVTGFEFTGAGQIPRPKMIVSNFLSTITALLLTYQDLLGVKVTRKRTLKKYLDAGNFPGGVNASADPSAEFPDDIYFIDRKSNENRLVVEFELASSMDLIGVQLPRRVIIQNACTWRYRGPDCGYTGDDYFTVADQPTDDVNQDVCGKKLRSCKLRFGESRQLPFGAFPGADLFR